MGLEAKELTAAIIGAAMEVHRTLGLGLYEAVYEECLCHELKLRGIAFERQVALPVSYKGMDLPLGYRLDLVVEDRVVLELKSVDELTGRHEAQLLTYLRLSGNRVGLVLNFGAKTIKDGIMRRVL